MSKVIIEPTVQLISGSHYETVKTKNGIIDEKDLRKKKEVMLVNKATYLLDDIISHTREYPNADTNTAMVEIKADFVIIQREEYENLIKSIEDE